MAIGTSAMSDEPSDNRPARFRPHSPLGASLRAIPGLAGTTFPVLGQIAQITALTQSLIPKINVPVVPTFNYVPLIGQAWLAPKINLPAIPALNSALRIGEAWESMMRPFRTFWAEWAEFEKAAEKLESAGWLPHPTLPQELFATVDEMDAGTIGEQVEAYYRDHWDGVEEQFRRNFRNSGLDEEAFAAVDEALIAHRHGLYRACCRTVFPEIERVARIRFYDGKGATITSLREVRESILELPLSDVTDHGYWAMRVLHFIEEHCYAPVKADDDVDARSSLPNRHAIAHGRIPYASARDSINSLVAADFMFRALNAIVSNRAEGEGG